MSEHQMEEVAKGVVIWIWSERNKLAVSAVLGAAIGLGAAELSPPIYMSQALLLPPTPQQSAAASALGSLGALAGMAGTPSVRNPADQFVAYLQSDFVINKIIEEFKLVEAYDVKLKIDAKKELMSRTTIVAGKKDGLITVAVEDEVPSKAARLVGAYVAGLQQLVSKLAVDEARQRRKYFELRYGELAEELTKAQSKLANSSFSSAEARTEPKLLAEEYQRLVSQLAAAETSTRVLALEKTDAAPEMRRQKAMVSALRDRLRELEDGNETKAGDVKYTPEYRKYRYMEALAEVVAKQYEAARIDEGREGAFIQIIDQPSNPEKKIRPKRSIYALVGVLASILSTLAFLGARRRRVVK
jgi:capsule polysaccharide export protein KpsE/RkpR